MSRARVGTAGAALAVLLAPAAIAAGAPPAVGWTELRFEARKLLVSAATTVRLTPALPAEVGERLESLTECDVLQGTTGSLLAVTLESELPLGRDEVATAWVRAQTGEAVASEKVSTQRRKVWKVRRYRVGGFTSWRAEPATEAEQRQPPADWTRRKTETGEWKPPDGLVVSDSYALFWLLSRVPREQPGGVVGAAIFTRDRLVEVELVGDGLVERTADFVEVAADGERRRRSGKILTRAIRIGAREVADDGPDDQVDLGFMGMRGELVAYVDLATGVPIEIRGRAAGIGPVTVRLKRAVLAG